MLLNKRKIFSSAVSLGLAAALLMVNAVAAVADETDGASYTTPVTVESSDDCKAVVNKECKDETVVDCDITVSESGDYELYLQYISKNRVNPSISLEIDGEYPFEEAKRIEFTNDWIDGETVRDDERGNQISPEQKLSEELVTCVARDRTGVYEKPYTVELDAGVHNVKIKVFTGVFDLKNVILRPAVESPEYEEWLEDQDIDKSAKDTYIIEAEKAQIKTNRAIISLADSTSANVNPPSPIIKKLNYIGGSNWSDVGDSITWNFDVKESGYYYLGFQYRQNTILNGITYRDVKIDGVTPFKEAERVKFTYGTGWQYTEFKGKKNPYYFYLEEGPHTITLTATAGELCEVYSKLTDIIASFGDLYIDITMIVGETVDNYRSYELFRQIPDFNDRLQENIDALNELIKIIEDLQEATSGSLVSNMVSAVETLQQMIDNPYSAHRYKSSYYTAYTNLSATLGSLTDMPLDLDRIYIIGSGAGEPDVKNSVFKTVGFSIKRFFNSFVSDYSSKVTDENNCVTLWVNWGRDQAQVFKAMTREDFTPQTGIEVNVKITNAGFIQGILAGKGPDVLLGMSRTDPVNYAMRGALKDLNRFDDFNKTTERFLPGATLPYTYKDKVYALPDSQSFYMMFIRTDIMDEFGLDIPQTWDEYIRVATILQRSNLQVSLPYTQIVDSGTVNIGVGGLTLYPTLLLQNNLDIYDKDLTKCILTEPGQLQVFTEWTRWYTDYKIPSVMDFYNRFRVGSAPIGISAYPLITQIKATAPEINGKWTVTEIPGTVKEDGTIDRSTAGSGSGCGITKLCKNPKLAWEFIKWWTSADAQVKYSNNLESYIGPLGRVSTANLEAFDQLGWDPEFLPALMAQQKNVKEIPEIPGGYYTGRGIDQAFWNVLEQSKKPKDMMVEWTDVINKEILRKRTEYGD